MRTSIFVSDSRTKTAFPRYSSRVFEVRNKTICLDMELDSASPITFVPYCFYQPDCDQLTVNPSAYTFSSYSNGGVHILRFVTVAMFLVNSRRHIVEVYVS
ncbi:unnamed protein product, partial [Dicrocoelium dendriticum]